MPVGQQHALPRRHLGAHGRDEVDARVAGMRVRRQRDLGVETADEHVDGVRRTLGHGFTSRFSRLPRTSRSSAARATSSGATVGHEVLDRHLDEQRRGGHGDRAVGGAEAADRTAEDLAPLDPDDGGLDVQRGPDGDRTPEVDLEPAGDGGRRQQPVERAQRVVERRGEQAAVREARGALVVVGDQERAVEREPLAREQLQVQPVLGVGSAAEAAGVVARDARAGRGCRTGCARAGPRRPEASWAAALRARGSTVPRGSSRVPTLPVGAEGPGWQADGMDEQPTTTDLAEGVDGTAVAYRERVHAPVLALARRHRAHRRRSASRTATASAPPPASSRSPCRRPCSPGGCSPPHRSWSSTTVSSEPAGHGCRCATSVASRRSTPPRAATRAAALADPAAYLCLRSWTSRTVLVEVEDPEDPHPYWLVTTRHGHDLAPVLAAARDSALAASAD